MAVTNLHTIPPEMVCHISAHLNTADLCSLRLVNKAVEAALFEPFASEFFHKKQFMLTEDSLQALIDLGEHEQLGKALRHLVIGLDHYENIIQRDNPMTDNRTDDERLKLVEYISGSSAQKFLLTSGCAKDMLAHALGSIGLAQRFPNLETIDIRDFNSTTRVRDGSAWSSLGASTVQRRTGQALSMTPTGTFDSFTDQAFVIVFQALAESKRVGVGIETVFRDPGHGLGPWCFSPTRSAASRALLAGLTKLHLCLDHRMRRPDVIMAMEDGAKHTYYNSRALQTFLAQAPKLTWLRLNFQHPQYQSKESVPLLCWLGLPPSTQVPGSIPRFEARLERLDLGSVRLKHDEITNVLSRFRDTLRAFSLWNITVRLTEQQFEDRDTGLRSLFARLGERLPHLREINIGRLSVISTTLFNRHVSFPKVSTNPRQPDVVSHNGDRAAEFLKSLGEDASVDWPAPDLDDGDDAPFVVDDDSDSDEDADDDEEMVDDDDLAH